MSEPSTALNIIESTYQRHFAEDEFHGVAHRDRGLFAKQILLGAEGPIARFRARQGMAAATDSITGTVYQVMIPSLAFSPPEATTPTYVVVCGQRHIEVKPADPSIDIANILSEMALGNTTPYGGRVAARLTDLFNESISDGEGVMSLGSLKYAWNFLQKIQPAAYPDIALSLMGNIKFGWGRSVDGRFSAEFFPNGRVRYVMLYKDNIADIRSNHISAESASEVVLSQLNATPKWNDIKNYRFD